jgi:alpha-galactosidase
MKTRISGRCFLLLSVAILTAHSARGLTNGVALTPPMGWNSWNRFYCGINQTLIRQTADATVASGMSAAGYEFINLDDC